MSAAERCWLQIVEWDWPVDPQAQEKEPGVPHPCDAELHLVWHFDWPLDVDDVLFTPVQRQDIAARAYTDSWEIVCENGHTLARSSGEESAEPFIASLVLPDEVVR